MIGNREESRDERFWSFLLTGVFLALAGWFIYILYGLGVDFKDITLFEILILTLASFRLTRLIVYDTIALCVRDFVLDKSIKQEKNGLCTVCREKPKKGLKRKLCELVSCPWCIGVWIALVVVFFHYYMPQSWFVFVFLAVAGLATLIQLTANLIGWHAEGKKLDVQKKGK